MDDQTTGQYDDRRRTIPRRSDAKALTSLVAAQGVFLLMADKQLLPGWVSLIVWMLLFGAVSLILVTR